MTVIRKLEDRSGPFSSIGCVIASRRACKAGPPRSLSARRHDLSAAGVENLGNENTIAAGVRGKGASLEGASLGG